MSSIPYLSNIFEKASFNKTIRTVVQNKMWVLHSQYLDLKQSSVVSISLSYLQATLYRYCCHVCNKTPSPQLRRGDECRSRSVAVVAPVAPVEQCTTSGHNTAADPGPDNCDNSPGLSSVTPEQCQQPTSSTSLLYLVRARGLWQISSCAAPVTPPPA